MTPEQREQLQAIWSAKITSAEEFKAKIAEHHKVLCDPNIWSEVRDCGYRADRIRSWYVSAIDSSYGSPTLPSGSFGDHGQLNLRAEDHPWWLLRDMIRQIVGVYEEPTSVQKWLRSSLVMMGWQFVHTARGNAEQVAYNADLTNAVADRKLTTTLGRYLRKVLPHAPDDFIANLEAQHRGELDDTFLVARTPKEIELVYTTMAGDGGCMRYSKGHFGNSKYHPSAVYSSPGLGVAYLKNAAGQIVARSVIYDNPEDNNDRRYVRIYGDAALGSKLKRSGYRCAGLRGVKMNIFRDPRHVSEPARMVMPYLDPAGGRGSSEDRKYDGTYAVKYAGEDFLRILSYEDIQKLRNLPVDICSVQNTSAYITLTREIDPSQFSKQCALTGETFSALEHEIAYILLNGEPALVRADRIDHGRLPCAATYLSSRNTESEIHLTQEEYEARVMDNLYVNEHARARNGWRELDPALYPMVEGQTMRQRMISPHGAQQSVAIASDGSFTTTGYYIRQQDRVFTLSADNQMGHIHKDQGRQLLETGKFVATPKWSGVDLYVHVDHPNLVQTARKKHVVIGYHPYLRDFKGRVISSRSATKIDTRHDDFYLPRDLTSITEEDYAILRKKAYDSAIDRATHSFAYYCESDMHRRPAVYSGVGAFSPWNLMHPRTRFMGAVIVEGQVRHAEYSYSSSETSVESAKAAAAQLLELSLYGDDSLMSRFGRIEIALMAGMWAWTVKATSEMEEARRTLHAEADAALEALETTAQEQFGVITSISELGSRYRQLLSGEEDIRRRNALGAAYNARRAAINAAIEAEENQPARPVEFFESDNQPF